MTWRNLSLLAVLCLPVPAQEDPLAAAQLRTTLTFLASDELAGRDSPSRGLREARDYLIARLQAAKVAPGVGESYVHEYELPGVTLPHEGVTCALVGDGEKRELAFGEDVRIWRLDAAFQGEAVEVLRPDMDAPGSDRLLRRLRGNKPVILEVETDSPLWRATEGAQQKLGSTRGGASAPWLLVRKGVLPAGDLKLNLNVPAPTAGPVQLWNVVGVLRQPEAKEWLVFSAHYDHIGIGVARNGDSINNGADDDGTGTTTVLALAEAFARSPTAAGRNLAFVFFSAEEKGLRGSRAFVAAPPFPLADIAAVVNLEMLGRPPEGGVRKAWITGHDLSDFATRAQPALARAGVELIEFAMAANLFSASDNLPFAQQGVVAHSISAGSLHADYHQPSDEVSRIDFEHMSAVARGVFEFGKDLAAAKERPAFNDQGKARLQLR